MSYSGSYAPKIIIFNSEFSDGVLLLDIVILILHIPNALLISLYTVAFIELTKECDYLTTNTVVDLAHYL